MVPISDRIAFRGLGEAGLAPKDDHRVDVAITAWKWGSYLGAEGLEQGVDVSISSWQRTAPNTIPAMAKAGGNYLSGQLISGEAKRLGFAEGIALSTDGTISEGAGENVFIVKDGKIITPPSSSSILSGLTRDTVIKLASRLNITVEEKAVPREALYLARRDILHGNSRRGYPGPFCRSHRGRTRPSRPNHPATAGRVFWAVQRRNQKDDEGWLESVESGTVVETSSD